ncbi:hypothetical protein [Mesorhizobium sp. IMUNJ 23232]|uniref:hypothetical protein n=1 Tax=Mesorhizobium sp. IMUNJ 23232 TaxID=3376064 RepID=UPI0037AC7D6D
MWDFEIGRTIGIVLRTWPFVVFRMIVYFGITLAFIVVTATGAGVGYGAGHIFDDAGGPLGLGLWGGVAGFTLVSAVLYWAREYILYIVKAGHIAVMVHLIDGHEVPGGQGQIAYARQVVTAHFGEANTLFVLDQLIKGAILAITGLIGGITAFIPIPGLSTLVSFVNSVIRMSMTYVDEIILGYNIRQDSTEPFDTACRAVVLYAQNGKAMIKNALWLTIFMWVIAIVVFLSTLAPAAAVLYYMPGQLAGWGFVLAIIFTWAFSSAFIEPFCIAALMQVYFRRIEGQAPDPEWDRRLSDASKKFRELKEKAGASVGGAAWGRAPGTA